MTLTTCGRYQLSPRRSCTRQTEARTFVIRTHIPSPGLLPCFHMGITPPFLDVDSILFTIYIVHRFRLSFASFQKAPCSLTSFSTRLHLLRLLSIQFHPLHFFQAPLGFLHLRIICLRLHVAHFFRWLFPSITIISSTTFLSCSFRDQVSTFPRSTIQPICSFLFFVWYMSITSTRPPLHFYAQLTTTVYSIYMTYRNVTTSGCVFYRTFLHP
ncbi:hypothetical protein BDN72DRAFT_132754 [Pluteus cervinus]|uniref:Uncharacterized protein n=1 Tax=Pluteus cervinus TaxID=181527 RepID=A0ACD3ALZ4_9AGAR|nr:hypothetical protein BDN72DRAFT_132754 [Pluteus cervinus]